MTDNTNRQTIEDSQPQVPVITNPAALPPQVSVVRNSTTFQPKAQLEKKINNLHL